MKNKGWILGVVIVVLAGMFLLNGGNESYDDTFEEQEKANTEEDAKIMTEDEAVEYRNACLENSFAYSDLIRYEEEYIGKDYVFQVQVSQVIEGGKLRVYDDAEGNGSYLNNEYYIMDERTLDTTKIIEDDIIAVYGKYAGLVKITRALGNTTDEIPGFYMYLCDIENVNSEDDEAYGDYWNSEGDENDWDDEAYGDYWNNEDDGNYWDY